MEACRACLATEEEMVPLDDAFIAGYNLLTNLNVALFDAMPQYVCQSCSQTVKFYVEFRDRCITTETSLQVILQKVKSEDDKPLSELKNEGIQIKQEVKDEEKAENDDFDFGTAFFDEFLPVKSENSEDIKPKKKRKHSKKKKSKTLKQDKVKPELNKMLSCGLCEKTFKENTELSDHIESHKDKLFCKLCSSDFKLWPTLVGHRFLHIPYKEFRCHICKSARWGGAVSMEYHYMNKHYDGEKVKLTCKVCFRGYDTPRKLSKHINHSHSKKSFICDYCNKTFNNKMRLKSHIRCHSDNRGFVCELCGFASKHSGGLKDHKIRKHCPAKVKCKECLRWFENAEIKDKHVCNRVPKICPICGLQVSQTKSVALTFPACLSLEACLGRTVNGLMVLLWFHGREGVASSGTRHALALSQLAILPPPRSVPEELQRQLHEFTRHMQFHSTVKRYKCTRCSAAYKTKDALVAHNNRHDGIRPVQCPFCPQKFYTQSVLIKHKRIHTGEKPYVCKVCSKGFTGNNNLKVHMKVHGEYLVVKRNKPEDAPLFPFPPPRTVNYFSSDKLVDNRTIESD